MMRALETLAGHDKEEGVGGAPRAKNVAVIHLALAAIVLSMAAYITYVAMTVRVEQYDGYVYLNNAKRLLDLPPARFEHIRPPLLSLAAAASVRLAAFVGNTGPGCFVWPHLTAVIISLLSALAVGFMLRRHLGTTLAFAGIALFVVTRLFLRYGPFAMADILSAGTVAVALALYARTWTDGKTPPAWRDFRRTGVLVGCAMLAKQPLGLILPALALSEVFYALHFRRLERRRVLGLALTTAVGVLVFVGIQLLIFTWLYGEDALEAAAYSAKYDFSPRSVSNRLVASTAGDSNWDYATLAWHTLSPPVFLAGVAGLVLALKQRQARDLPYLAWLAVLGGTIVCMLSHTEARYLLPLVPIWLYFAMRALEAGVQAGQRWWSHGRAARVVLVAVGCLSVASVLWESAVQVWLNLDPFYTADGQRRTLHALLSARGPQGKLRWFGPLATYHPARLARLKGDDYFDIFHIGADSLEYFLSEAIVPANRIADLGDGDAVLKAPDTYYRSSSLPKEGAPPPQIWNARVLGPSPDSSGGVARMQTPNGDIVVRVVRLAASPASLLLTPESDLGTWYVYFRLQDGTMVGGRSTTLQAWRAIAFNAPAATPVMGVLLMRVASTP